MTNSSPSPNPPQPDPTPTPAAALAEQLRKRPERCRAIVAELTRRIEARRAEKRAA